MPKLENEVVVTRKGQTTIPVRLRQKYKIEEGTRLQVIETEEGDTIQAKEVDAGSCWFWIPVCNF